MRPKTSTSPSAVALALSAVSVPSGNLTSTWPEKLASPAALTSTLLALISMVRSAASSSAARRWRCQIQERRIRRHETKILGVRLPRQTKDEPERDDRSAACGEHELRVIKAVTMA